MRVIVILCFLIMGAGRVLGGEDIGSVSSTYGGFDKIVDLLKSVTQLMEGPWAKAAMIFSLVCAFVTWNIAPGRSEIIGRICRIVVSLIVLLNIGALITFLKIS